MCEVLATRRRRGAGVWGKPDNALKYCDRVRRAPAGRLSHKIVCMLCPSGRISIFNLVNFQSAYCKSVYNQSKFELHDVDHCMTRTAFVF